MRRLALIFLLITACKTKEVERHGKASIVRESRNAWYDWEHSDHHDHVECDGKRVATNVNFHSGNAEFIAYGEAPSTLMLVDTTDCTVIKLITDHRMNVFPVDWSRDGQFGFMSLTGTLGGGNSGTIDVTRGASASFIIRATHPPTMEPLDGQAWLAVGSSSYGISPWSPAGNVLLLARHLSSDPSSRGYEVATWSPEKGLHVFDFKSPDGQNFPTHGWNGATPYIDTPAGPVVLR